MLILNAVRRPIYLNSHSGKNIGGIDGINKNKNKKIYKCQYKDIYRVHIIYTDTHTHLIIMTKQEVQVWR